MSLVEDYKALKKLTPELQKAVQALQANHSLEAIGAGLAGVAESITQARTNSLHIASLAMEQTELTQRLLAIETALEGLAKTMSGFASVNTLTLAALKGEEPEAEPDPAKVEARAHEIAQTLALAQAKDLAEQQLAGIKAKFIEEYGEGKALQRIFGEAA